MSGMFGAPKQKPVVTQTVEPEIVDESAKVQEEESKRKKRKGVASHFVANSNSMADVATSKNTLGA